MSNESMQNASNYSIERKSWPGPLANISDKEAYMYDAMQPFLTSWKWDDPERRSALLSVLNADQLAVWAIWNIDGQIDNGGIVQAISNSYGELCEDALIGFNQIGLKIYAEAMDHVLSCYERPISRDRRERNLMLERVAGMTGDPKDLSRFRELSYRSEIYTKCSVISAPAESIYWKLKKEKNMEDSLSAVIDARKGSFFSNAS